MALLIDPDLCPTCLGDGEASSGIKAYPRGGFLGRHANTTCRLIQPNGNVALDPSSEMHLSLEVHLDANHESSGLVLAVVIDGAAQELTFFNPSDRIVRCGQSGVTDSPAG